MHRSRSDLIMNVEHFTRIDLDRSRFEKECNRSHVTLNSALDYQSNGLL